MWIYGFTTIGEWNDICEMSKTGQILDHPAFWDMGRMSYNTRLALEGELKTKQIIQGLRVAQAAVTERWP